MRMLLGGFVALALLGCGKPNINFVDPFAAVNWSPHDGASCINKDWPNLTMAVCMSREVDATSAGANASIQAVDANGDPDGTPITASVGLSAQDPACIEFSNPVLQDATDYMIVLDSALTGKDGTVLGHRLTSRFRTTDASCS